MSLFGSLYTGVAGLSAQSTAMGMISDNIANVNTVAYKGANAQFATMVTDASKSHYQPGGVRASAVLTTSNQGLIQSSTSELDVAISGNGFFTVNAANDGTGEQLYTRAGSFAPDFRGNLQTVSGFYLQGWALDADETIINANVLETVNIAGVSGTATATNLIQIGANLDADQVAAVGYVAGDMAAGTVQPHFLRSMQVYDSLGRPQEITTAFVKTAPNTWEVEIYATDVAEIDAAVHPNGLLATGSVTFNGDGSLASAATIPDPVAITWNAAGGADPSSIEIDFGDVGETDGLSQFSAPSNVGFVLQNGAEVGELNGVRIDEEGYVVASFTNGEERRIYQIPLATFSSPNALDPRSGNVYAQTEFSGEFNLHAALSGGAGTIMTSSLEAANVDIADEFTKMIVTQRAYSANTRVITTADEMLSELIQIKR